MIAGHFGLAAAVKAKERQVPLWALMLATVWLDVLFGPLFLAGLETIQPIDGGGYGKSIIHADYTHSLVGALVLGALFGGVAAVRWGRRTGVVLAAVVFSHWVLDLIVHRMDLPILPGNAGDLPLLGFGLWRSAAASIVVELALVVAGSYLYWRAAEDVSRSADKATRRRARVVAIGVLASGIVTLLADVVVG